MIAFERHDYICRLIEKKSVITINELTKALNVSAETVRRDLLYLESQNKLTRTHGGAISSIETLKSKSYEARLDEYTDRKEELSKYAASLITEGDIIGIDSGTTAIYFCEKIAKKFSNLTVVTHSTDVLKHLGYVPGIKVIVCGGNFIPEQNAFCGMRTVEEIKNYHVSKTFLFPGAISLKNGIFDFKEHLVEVQKSYLAISDKVIIMADSSKFEKNAFIKICDITSFQTFVTDSNLNDEIYNLYRENNIDIIKGKIK